MSAPVFSRAFEVRWADVDANRHMRHSAYADYAAHARYSYFESLGFDATRFGQLQIGPILFREELIYRREVHMSETITVDVKLAGAREDFSRWAMRTTITRQNGEVACIVNIEGAWLDLATRKLTVPPQDLLNAVAHLPKTDDFAWLPPSQPKA